MHLRVTHCLAQNMDAPFEAVARHLEQHCGVHITFEREKCWQNRQELVAHQAVDLAWTCGLLYCFERKRHPNTWQAFAAVSLSATHYSKQPIYFTEVVYSAASSYKTLSDLKGTRFVYNDAHSLSGYYALWHTLKERSLDLLLTERRVSGGHYASLAFLLENKADFALIDSSVYESWQRTYPDKAAWLRSLERLGPYPSPPLLLNASLDAGLQERIKQSILTMPSDYEAKQAFTSAGIKGFLPVDVEHYDNLEPLTELELP